MDKLALTLPGGFNLTAPGGVPTGGTSMLSTILTASINLLFVIAAILTVIFLILGGIRWITSAGDPKGVEVARKQITYAIVGLVIVVLAFFIVGLVGQFFNIKLFGP